MILNYRIFGREDSIVEFERELLDMLIRLVGKEEMVAHEIHFCIHEAILNILQHTYKWDLNLPIEVRMVVSGSDETHDKTLEISIKDIGPSIGEPLIPPAKVDKFQMRKRGLYMISKIMDEFHIKPVDKNGNITFMKKVLSHTDDQLADVVS